MPTSMKPIFLLSISFLLGISSFLYNAQARPLAGCILGVLCKDSMVTRSYQRHAYPPPTPKRNPPSPPRNHPPSITSIEITTEAPLLTMVTRSYQRDASPPPKPKRKPPSPPRSHPPSITSIEITAESPLLTTTADEASSYIAGVKCKESMVIRSYQRHANPPPPSPFIHPPSPPRSHPPSTTSIEITAESPLLTSTADVASSYIAGVKCKDSMVIRSYQRQTHPPPPSPRGPPPLLKSPPMEAPLLTADVASS